MLSPNLRPQLLQDATNPLGLDFSCFGTASSPILETARRGMQLQQLLAIIAFIEMHADERGVLLRWVDWNGAANHTDSLNLYDLVKYVVNPATAPYKCSFVELVAPPGTTAQTPRWFVSHWWGEPVKDFIKAVEYHAVQRFAPRGEFERNERDGKPAWEIGHKPQHKIVGKPADADATYWVCAYANNQHDLSELDVKDPRDTPFFKAMQLCDGVLVILDKDGKVFTRIWCGFEQATVAQGKKLKFDIATVHNGEPELLTDGFAYELPDDDPAKNSLEAATMKTYVKTAREKHFPVALLEKAYTIQVELGQASVKS